LNESPRLRVAAIFLPLTRRFRDCYKGRSRVRSSNESSTGIRSNIRFDKGAPVNKSELIDAIAKHADISKAAAGRALDATVNSIRGSLKRGDIVTLVGFGSFYVGKRTAREGRNPRTGAAIKIKAAKVPKFRAGKALRESVN
jgi:DNA-binding protein HU-beta